MTAESLHIFVQIVQLVVSLVGFAVVIYKGGKYIGSTETKINYMLEDAIQVKKDLNEHQVQDIISQREVIEKLTNIRISLAKLNKFDNLKS